jgi:hypothetical protein
MAKRTLSDWASIAEIIGAVAVVASILYVGYEINRNTKVSLASNRQAIASRAQELALYSAETNIYRLLFDPSGDDIELTESEQNHLTAYIGALLRTTEEAYLLYRDGMLEEEYWGTRAGVMLAALRSPKARQVFFDTRDAGFYTPDFAAWANDALEKRYGT